MTPIRFWISPAFASASAASRKPFDTEVRGEARHPREVNAYGRIIRELGDEQAWRARISG